MKDQSIANFEGVEDGELDSHEADPKQSYL
jgi:hypothetical protein